MNSSKTIRCLIGTLSNRPPTFRASFHRRNYVTPSTVDEEIDPQLNGYPQLPLVSRQYLPATGWWDTQMRRNFGDTLHEEEEIVSMWGPDISVVNPQTALFQFTLVALGFVGFGFIVQGTLVPERTAVPREYPFSGLVAELGGSDENKARIEEVREED